MPDIRRPQIIPNTLLETHRAWNKHTTDNIDRLNRQLETPLLELSRTSNQLIPHAVATAVTWQTPAIASRGSVITHSTGTFTVSEAGTYLITAGGQFESGTYTNQLLWIQTADTVRWGMVGGTSFVTQTQMVTGWPITLSAGATFQICVAHSNAAVADRNFTGGTGVGGSIGRACVQRLY